METSSVGSIKFTQCRAPRDVVIVQGDDAATFLHSQLAQDISHLAVGSSVHSFVLEPTGHVVAIARVFRHVDSVFTLDVDHGLGEQVVARLKKFVLRARVTMRVSDWNVHTYWGTGVREALSAQLGSSPAWWGDADVVDVVSSPGDEPLVGAVVSQEEWHVLRVDSRWPCVGVDIEVGDVPAATGVVRVAASFTKGCYPGQELVERMDSRGTSAPVAVRVVDRGELHVGDVLTENDEVVGTVTSIGTRCALARVKRGSSVGADLGAASAQ